MEKELNIAAILKDKQDGIILFDRLRGISVYFSSSEDDAVYCYPNKESNSYFSYDEYGKYESNEDAIQILVPSKEMRSWEKFAWKKGDVLLCGKYELCIFDKWANDQYTKFYGRFSSKYYSKDNIIFDTKLWTKVENNNTRQLFIKRIEEFHNGKLNLETLVIEKPKQEFKDGDIVYLNTKNGLQYVFAYDANKEMITSYIVAYCITLEEFAHIETQYICRDNMINSIHLATDSEKQQLFSALENEGKRWKPDTKQIEDLSKKCELKPFDKVLVRDTDAGIWMPTLFGFYDEEFKNYVCLNDVFQKCIPYNDSTKHLLGTTDEWKGGEG